MLLGVAVLWLCWLSCVYSQLHDSVQYPVRLVGSEEYAGRVEIMVNGTWGTVCDANWGNDDATVVCRQLGFDPAYSQAVGGALFGQGFGPIEMSNVRCSSYESKLWDCDFDGLGHHSCSHSHDAGVICQPADIPIRLTGSTDGQGRVEILLDGVWGSVCDDSWDTQDAQVVCRQLGFNDSHATAVDHGFFGTSTGPIYLDDVSCSGYEPHISLCHHTGYGVSNCNHGKDAGVICHPPSVRLVGADADKGQGRVEIHLNGVWGSVCDDDWDNQDARVVCRQLGFDDPSALAVGEGFFGSSVGPILVNNFGCTGFEPDLRDCAHSGYGHHTCTHTEDAAVICHPETIPVRLVSNVEGEGLVEMQVNGVWGSVCGDNWDDQDAEVVCRQLGFNNSYAEAISQAFYGQSQGPIFVSNVACVGQEPHIAECANGGWGHHSCSHAKDAGVRCDWLELRLVNGRLPTEGRVEVRLNGEWGTVCDSYFDNNDAAVICRHLGFNSTSARAWSGAHFGQGTGPVYISGVNCAGSEQYLNLCHYYGYGITNCAHSHDAGVTCYSQ